MRYDLFLCSIIEHVRELWCNKTTYTEKMEKFCFLHVFALLGHVLSRDIPSFVNLCRRNHPEFSKCFNDTLFEMLPYMIKGIPEMDIPPIEPLIFSEVKVSTGEGTAVSFEAELSNGKVIGGANLAVPKLLANVTGDTVRYSAILEFPIIYIYADYKVKGKVMLFELNSMGRCETNATDVVLEIEWYGHKYLKEGKKHIFIDKVEVTQLVLHNMFLNLYDSSQESKPFMETVNKAINDNIDSLAAELSVLIKETLAQISVDYFNRVYTLFPFDQLFPEN